jgi:uncharacterized membrane protein YoaK (UPF0700 family)
VFVANMPGNLVFIGFALAGALGFSLGASLAALCGFLLGAFAAGRLIVRPGRSRETVLLRGIASELALLVVALGASRFIAADPDGADFTGFGHPVSREMATLFRRNWPPCFTGNGHPLG